MADRFERAYARLRAEILARHFSLSCYARADHFDMEAHLGVRAVAAADDAGASPGGITWTLPPPVRERPTGPFQPPVGLPPVLAPAHLYADAADLQQRLTAGALGDVERWRWAKHDRTNALLVTGFRLISLAVEARLGSDESLTVLRRALATLAVLFRFDDGQSPFSGYVLRWDPIASDLWETAPAPTAGGAARLVQNHEFLLNGDLRSFQQGRHYLYSTPLDDPRYLEAIRVHGEGQRGRDRYRRWEPSMDEYVGLAAGYYAIWFCLQGRTGGAVEAVLAEASRQADLVGRYLRHTGYFLVRPNGGFSARGALDVNPCFEYVLARALGKVSGAGAAAYRARPDATFEAAVRLAGHGVAWDAFQPDPAQFAPDLRAFLEDPQSWPKGALADGARGLVLDVLRNSPVQPIFGGRLAKAALFSDRFDIFAGAAPERRRMVALCYALSYLARSHPDNVLDPDAGAETIFNLWMRVPPSDDPSDAFRHLFAFTAADEWPTAEIRHAFRMHYDVYSASGDPSGRTEVLEGVDAGRTVSARAVRTLVARDPIDQAREAAHLEEELGRMLDALTEISGGRPPFIDANVGDKNGVPGAPSGTAAERPDARTCYVGYSVPLALAWLAMDLPVPVPFPTLRKPRAQDVRLWQTPSVPAAVVQAARARGFLVPVDTAIQRTAIDDTEAEHSLFKDPPPRPAFLGNPPEPVPALTAAMFPEAGEATYRVLNPLSAPAEQTFRRALPPRPAALPARDWRAAISDYAATVTEAVDGHHAWIDGNTLFVRVNFHVPSVRELFLNTWSNGRFRARVSVAWTHVTDPPP